VSYYSSLSFLLSSSLVVSSLTDKAANGADPCQKKPVFKLAQGGWIAVDFGAIL
jgi:hypothetical protein